MNLRALPSTSVNDEILLGVLKKTSILFLWFYIYKMHKNMLSPFRTDGTKNPDIISSQECFPLHSFSHHFTPYVVETYLNILPIGLGVCFPALWITLLVFLSKPKGNQCLPLKCRDLWVKPSSQKNQLLPENSNRK